MSSLNDGGFPEHDTVTRTEWREANGHPRVCLYCGKQLSDVQRHRGGRFCSPRCGGKYTARREYGPTGKPTQEQKEAAAMGAVHDLIGDEFDVVTGDKQPAWSPPPPDLVIPPVEEISDLIALCLAEAGRWSFEATIGTVTITVARGPQ